MLPEPEQFEEHEQDPEPLDPPSPWMQVVIIIMVAALILGTVWWIAIV